MMLCDFICNSKTQHLMLLKHELLISRSRVRRKLKTSTSPHIWTIWLNERQVGHGPVGYFHIVPNTMLRRITRSPCKCRRHALHYTYFRSVTYGLTTDHAHSRSPLSVLTYMRVWAELKLPPLTIKFPSLTNVVTYYNAHW